MGWQLMGWCGRVWPPQDLDLHPHHHTAVRRLQRPGSVLNKYPTCTIPVMPPFSPMRSKLWMGKWARESFQSRSKVTALKCKAWTGKDTGWALESVLRTPRHTPSIPASSSCSLWPCMAGSGHFQEEGERNTRTVGRPAHLQATSRVLSPHCKIYSVCVCVFVCVRERERERVRERERERLWTKVTARKVGICQQHWSGGGQPSQLLGITFTEQSGVDICSSHLFPPLCF